MVESSFLKCGITNNLDGSEDDLVYENSEEPIDDDSFVREMFKCDSESDCEGFDVSLFARRVEFLNTNHEL